MAAHGTDPIRPHRHQQETLARNALSAPGFLQRGAEPRRLEQLPWPRNLFGKNATAAELMAETALLEHEVWIVA